MAEVVVRLPESLRSAFKAPLGSLHTDAETVIAEAGRPVIAVGDVVTAHLLEADHQPALSVVDGQTKREQIDEWVATALPSERVAVENPPGTLTAGMLSALATGIEAADGRTLGVDGEEDLVALPAIVAAPEGASVVYGQPDEGMVLVSVTPDATREARQLLERMDGDPTRALAALGVE